jgi:hypothetical protein
MDVNPVTETVVSLGNIIKNWKIEQELRTAVKATAEKS